MEGEQELLSLFMEQYQEKFSHAIKILLLYSFSHLRKGEDEQEGGKQTELPSSGSFPKCPQSGLDDSQCQEPDTQSRTSICVVQNHDLNHDLLHSRGTVA